VEAVKDKNAVCIRKAKKLIDELCPDALVLEAFERRDSERADRITKLGRALVALAADAGIECAIYTRRDIEVCFATVGARTRDEIAEAVARHLPALSPRLPERRRAWEAEDRRMGLFASAALVLTHYRHEALFVLGQRQVPA
jgi:Holliday junction resolvasome RuvABC endonuclease subunit